MLAIYFKASLSRLSIERTHAFISGLRKLLPPMLAAAGLKAWLVWAGRVPFNADEAVVALMARHILQGERPAFFYGQAYMGSLDAWLVAAGFAMFGQQVWVIRLVQAVLYLGTIATTHRLGRTALGSERAGMIAAWLLAVPAVNVTLYTTASLGGYGEALLIGNLLLLAGLRIATPVKEKGVAPAWLWAAWGFLAGLGLWAFGLTLVYSLPVGLWLVWLVIRSVWARYLSPEARLSDGESQPAKASSPIPNAGVEASAGRQTDSKGQPAKAGTLAKAILSDGEGQPAKASPPNRKYGAAVPLFLVASGALLGSAPWWGYAFSHGFGPLIRELQGGNIAGVEGLPWLEMVVQHLASLALLGGSVIFGLRPPWAMRWLGLPLLPFALIFWLGALVYAGKHVWPLQGKLSMKKMPGTGILAAVMVTLLAGFVLTPFGADPSGRYFLPLAAPLALIAAWTIDEHLRRAGAWAWIMLVTVLVFNFWGTIQSAQRYPPGLTTQFNQITQIDPRFDEELIRFLREHGARRGYTNYWVAYPLAFLSAEELIFVPRLPYHPDFRYTSRDDRYEPYNERVEQAGRVAYITTHHPALNERLRERFAAAGVTWKEAQIGDYHIFYDLSDKLSVEQFHPAIWSP